MKIDLQNVTLRYTCGRPDQFPADGIPQVAFSGRSNVGKSSLINALIGRKSLARVSSQPGKTITVNFYDAGRKLYLVDLPGYGFAKRSAEDQKRWSGLVDGYITGSEALRLVVQLVDMRIGPTADDNMMLNYLIDAGIPCLLVATKSDKLNKTEYGKMLSALQTHPLLPEGTEVIPFSALHPTTTEQIRNAIFSSIK